MPAHNPYEPPRAESRALPIATNPLATLASLGKRFFGAAIDALFNVATASALSYAYAAMTGQTRTALMLQACMFLPLGLQWMLVAMRGQTLGKILLRTRIVLANGDLPGFTHGVMLRAWPVLAVSVLPTLLPGAADSGLRMLGSLATLADCLAIFAAGRRCIHDRIAGTFVVDVG